MTIFTILCSIAFVVLIIFYAIISGRNSTEEQDFEKFKYKPIDQLEPSKKKSSEEKYSCVYCGSSMFYEGVRCAYCGKIHTPPSKKYMS